MYIVLLSLHPGCCKKKLYIYIKRIKTKISETKKETKHCVATANRAMSFGLEKASNTTASSASRDHLSNNSVACNRCPSSSKTCSYSALRLPCLQTLWFAFWASAAHFYQLLPPFILHYLLFIRV